MAGAGAQRDLRASTPGFDLTGLTELGLFAKKGEQSRTSRFL